jgi:DNA ligase-1
MVRSGEGKYKYGRSTLKEFILAKLKRMASDEAVITGVVELQRNLNEATTNNLGYTERSSHQEGKSAGGTMGALIVKCLRTAAEFQLGTGFTAEDRAFFWENRDGVLGKIVTFDHFPVGRKDLPRHPSFKGLRSAEDML